MKPFILIILIQSLFIFSKAQEKSSFVALRSGTSFPLGEYSSKDPDKGSFALVGFNVTLEGAWFFNRWIGIGASAGLDLHPIDASELASAKFSNDAFMTSLVVRSDPFQVLTFMAGPSTHFSLGRDVLLTGKLLCGAIQASTPYQLYKAEYFMIGPRWYEITSARDWEMSFLAGLGIRYDISGCIGVIFDTDFTYNKCEFGFVTSEGLRTDNKKVIFLNTTLGISIAL
jgi:hypothetical protein